MADNEEKVVNGESEEKSFGKKIVDNVIGFFAYQDNENPEEEEEEEEEKKAPAPVKPARPAEETKNIKEGKILSKYEKKPAENTGARTARISIFEPRSFKEVFDIAAKLKEDYTVVVNMRKVPANEKLRIVDVLQGVTFALEGIAQYTDNESLLCTPNCVGVDGRIEFENKDDDYE